MALLLGAMLIVGLNPGPEMLKSRLDVTFSMVWVLILSNIIVAALCFLILNHLAALTFIRGSLLDSVPDVSSFHRLVYRQQRSRRHHRHADLRLYRLFAWSSSAGRGRR